VARKKEAFYIAEEKGIIMVGSAEEGREKTLKMSGLEEPLVGIFETGST